MILFYIFCVLCLMAGCGNSVQNETIPTPEPLDITICFAGDISLADDAVTVQQWEKYGRDLGKCISPELLTIMNSADVMCVNNEFTFSDLGNPLEGKMYTFRAKPERVSLLSEMGVDLALLANNHVYDYGEESMIDIFDTLESAGIGYFGAGNRKALFGCRCILRENGRNRSWK